MREEREQMQISQERGTVTPFPALKSLSLSLKKKEKVVLEASAKRNKYIVIGRGEGASLFLLVPSLSLSVSLGEIEKKTNRLTGHPSVVLRRGGQQRRARGDSVVSVGILLVFCFLFFKVRRERTGAKKKE